MLAIAVILIVFAVMTWLSVVNPRAAYMVVVFFLPWGGLVVDVGLWVSMWQAALAPLIIVTFLRAAQPGWVPPRISHFGLLMILVLHAIIWSLLQIGIIPVLSVEGGALRGPTARAIAQIIVYLFSLSPAIIGALLLRTTADVLQALRISIVSLIVLAFIGWIQVASWLGLGYNPLPLEGISIALGATAPYVREGQFFLGDLAIVRMNSLAGEPRNLATALVLGMIVIQAIALATPRINGRRLALIWVFFLVSTIATFSTSGALIWMAGTGALLPVMWLTRVPIQRSSRSIVIGLLAVIVPAVLGTAIAEAGGIPVIAILSERTLDRLTSDGAVEDFDLAITSYLKANPAAIVTGVGLGNAHLYATPYLDPLFALYAEGKIFQGKTSVVRIVSELGVIGFALFCWWYLSLVWSVRRVTIRNPDLVAAVPVAAMILVVFLTTNQVAGQTWLMAGVMAALCRQRAPAVSRFSAVPA